MHFGNRILILSFYFEPDLCAGSFRATALVRELRGVLPAGTHIDVITTLPNRYKSFTVDVAQQQESEGVLIHRIRLPAHQSGMIDQSKAFYVYASEVLAHVRGRQYDLVFATSSRLMTAALGAWVARRVGAPLYLDIRDIFVDTIGDVLPGRLSRALKPVFSQVEQWTIKRARRTNLVSGGFEPYFRSRYKDLDLRFFTNGIDEEFLSGAAGTPDRQTGEPIKLVYAGNIGEGQGLHHIVPGLAHALGERLEITVIGDGGRKQWLEQSLNRCGASNVKLMPPMTRTDLLQAYNQADVLFLHLNDYDAFKKVLPSKIFEYAALGKPILAGVAGYSADFIAKEIDNAAVFAPCDVGGAVRALGSLKLENRPREAFVNKFARKAIMKLMAADIASLVAAR